METPQIVDSEPIIDLIRRPAPGQAQRLQDLFGRLQPVICLERSNRRILFSAALGSPNVVTIGLECTRRLEAYAYVSSVLATASGLPHDSLERPRFYRLADTLLNWAVPRDLHEVLSKRTGEERSVANIMSGSDSELPAGFLGQLDQGSRLLGRRFFELACSFILLHELGHLDLGHSRCAGAASKEQENDADRFAASWMMDDPSASRSQRLGSLFGISTALLWPTVSNVYFGVRQSATHPEPYDRLFNVLDQEIDRASEAEFLGVWDLVCQILFIHMEHVGFHFDERRMQTSPREEASYLIDLLSKHQPLVA